MRAVDVEIGRELHELAEGKLSFEDIRARGRNEKDITHHRCSGRPGTVGKAGEAMSILESKADPSASRRILLATGLGAIFGFQSWRLAEYGFAVSIPSYGLAWVLLSHVFLGLSVGATAGFTRWWKRGLLLGLVFSIPSAFGALALGLKWVPYGVAAITGGLVVGLLIALIADALFPRTRISTDQPSPVWGRLLGTANAKSEKCSASATRQRLAEEKTCLEHLDAERAYRGDSGFGKTTEDRIVWSELLDLELQDIDEQVSRICQAAADASGHRSRKSNNSSKSRSK
jgi:hypothetical protein